MRRRGKVAVEVHKFIATLRRVHKFSPKKITHTHIHHLLPEWMKLDEEGALMVEGVNRRVDDMAGVKDKERRLCGWRDWNMFYLGSLEETGEVKKKKINKMKKKRTRKKTL